MTEADIRARLDELSDGVKVFDLLPRVGQPLNERQHKLFSGLLDLFRALRWQIPFNSFKELRYSGSKPIRPDCDCGKPVKVRPCGERFGGKTYFGIMLGDVALSISHSIDGDVVTASHSFYNPAILIPELGEIVYGCESWWGRIESKEELAKSITDETIANAWYVKALQGLSDNQEARHG